MKISWPTTSRRSSRSSDYLDLPISEGLKIAPPRLEKQADQVTEEWVERYKMLKATPLLVPANGTSSPGVLV